MIEELSRGMQYRSDIANTFIDVLKDTQPTHHRATDFLLVMCCAVAPHNRSNVRSLIKLKALSGAFTIELMRDAIQGNAPALEYLFRRSMLDLADNFVRAPEKAARLLGENLYIILFVEFSDTVQRQEVISMLVIHVGSVSFEEEDTALKVLIGIVSLSIQEHEDSGEIPVDDRCGPSILRPFLPFISSLLDCVHKLQPCHLRILFLLLFSVGTDNNGHESTHDMNISNKNQRTGKIISHCCNDVHIVIRKFLALSPISMKRIGIIGTICYAVSRSTTFQQEANDPNKQEETCTDNTDGINSLPPTLVEVIDMLEFVHKHCTPDIHRVSHNHIFSLGERYDRDDKIVRVSQ